MRGFLDRRYLGVIPARAGSKGVPGKNLKHIAGQPLIHWTLKAASEAKMLDSVVVTSDSRDVLEHAASFEGVKSLRRPIHLSQDDSSMLGVIEHVIEHEGPLHEEDCIVLLQPTSPLREAADIDDAITNFESSHAEALISVRKRDSEVLKWLTMESDVAVPISDAKFLHFRRQDLPPVYSPNGAIFITKIGSFLQHNTLVPPKTALFEMSELSSVDIDSFDDFELAETLLRSRLILN
jgi:CMP-N,N'-diacetyllegionaminic acid synthase